MNEESKAISSAQKSRAHSVVRFRKELNTTIISLERANAPKRTMLQHLLQRTFHVKIEPYMANPKSL